MFNGIKRRGAMLTRWSIGATLAAGMLLTGCAYHHHDHDRIYVEDERGYHHEGYYDEGHGWHGGYYDEHHAFHDDPADWHH